MQQHERQKECLTPSQKEKNTYLTVVFSTAGIHEPKKILKAWPIKRRALLSLTPNKEDSF